MGFKSFPVYRLESLIGEKTLKGISTLLPVFDHNIDIDNIYTKNNLIKVIFSFFDSSEFSKNELRNEFLFYQNEDKINAFCDLIKIDRTLQFDKKVNLIVSKGWSNKGFCSLFCKTFELPEKFIPESKENLPNVLLASKSDRPFKVLKDYQSVICFKALRKLDYNNSRFILQMPTGTGKTRTAMEVVSNQFNQIEKSCVIFWLVNSEELCEQAVECFLDVWEHVGNKDVKVVRAWGKNKIQLDENDRFTFIVGGFQKLYNNLSKDPDFFHTLKEHVNLIIVDEAHRVLAPTYKAVTDSLFGKKCNLIGLTATPGRGAFDDFENQKLSEYFNEEKLVIESPNNISLFSYLKSKGILSYAKYKSLITSPNIELTKKELGYLETNFDFSPSFIKSFGEDNTRNFEIIKEFLIKLKTHKKALFFACSVEHSKFICSTLNYLGIEASHIDGNTKKGTRQFILDEFKFGNLQVICNFGILSTGFDAPKTDLVFIARPTQSIVLYSQMIGRGLRGKEVGGTENCTIVTVKDNIIGLPSESNIFSYFDDYFE